MAFKFRNRSGMIISIYLEHLVCIIEKIPATEMLLCVDCIISYFNYLHEASTRIQHDSSWRILNYLDNDNMKYKFDEQKVFSPRTDKLKNYNLQ